MATKTIQLTAPQLELLADITRNPQMYLKRFSRWAKTGFVLERLGLAVVDTHGGDDAYEIKATADGRAEAQRRHLIPTPKVVVLCGSSTFPDEIAAVGRDEALAGHVVLGPWSFDRDLDATTLKGIVDAHWHMIGLADEVIVVAPDGFIGTSTRNEIEFAKRSGKPVRIIAPQGAGRG
jgi:hypothetical protein